MADQWSNHMAGVFAGNGGQIQDAGGPDRLQPLGAVPPARPRPGPHGRRSGLAQGRREHRRRRRRRRHRRTPSCQSPGHYANIVGDYDRVGIGVVTTADQIWVTLDFMEAATDHRLHRHGQRRPDGIAARRSPTSPRCRPGPVHAGPAPAHPRHPQRRARSAAAARWPLKIAGVGQVPGDAVGVVVNVTATGASRRRLPHRLPVRGDAADGLQRQLRGRLERAQPGHDRPRHRRAAVRVRQRHHPRDRRPGRLVPGRRRGRLHPAEPAAGARHAAAAPSARTTRCRSGNLVQRRRRRRLHQPHGHAGRRRPATSPPTRAAAPCRWCRT